MKSHSSLNYEKHNLYSIDFVNQFYFSKPSALPWSLKKRHHLVRSLRISRCVSAGVTVASSPVDTYTQFSAKV